MYFLRKSKKACSYIYYTLWKRAINFKSWQIFYSLKLTDLNTKPYSQFLLPHHKAKAWTKIRWHGYTRHYGFSDFSFFCLFGMIEHDNSFPKSIILFYELHSFFRYWILKLEALRQPVTKYIGTTTFCKSFPLPPFRAMFMGLQIISRPCCGQITDPQRWYREEGRGY